MSDVCRTCGKPVRVMAQQATGYCCQLCSRAEKPAPTKKKRKKDK